MMIYDLMKNVWTEENKNYVELFKYAESLSAKELYEKVKNKEMTFYSYPYTNMNLLACPVCTYRLDSNFSGCSMCNYVNDDLQHQAYMAALRIKNVSLYAKAILHSFKNIRELNTSPNVFELISSDDVFSDTQFPEEVFYELFKDNKLFSKKPFSYILETRASSVTQEKINLVKKYLPENSRVIIEFGVETGNEWIRNHWLNKSVSNTQIETAIDVIHKAGYKASADILIGIPGLTEIQSKSIFIDTIEWLEKLEIDQYVVLPLNRKDLTLQGIIYKYLKENRELKKLGLAQGEHTGIPWLTTVIKSIDEVLDNNPSLIKKLGLAQVYPYQNSVSNITIYNRSDCKCNSRLIETLWQYLNNRNRNSIKEACSYALSEQHDCNQDYQELLRVQKNQSITTTIKAIAYQLTPHIWPNIYENVNHGFDLELNQYKGVNF